MPADQPADAASGFLAAPERIALEGVHIWRFLSADESLVSAAERIQANRITSGPARTAFLAGRAGVRAAAARYSGRPPQDFEIRTGPDGKPFFAGGGPEFNVSHSGGSVVAVLSEFPVGIDLETPGRKSDFSAIARRFFHPAEAASIATEDEFLRHWTAKEAMLKLAGTGLAGGLDLARLGDGRTGELLGEPVFLHPFRLGAQVGAVASFHPLEVKGWFEI